MPCKFIQHSGFSSSATPLGEILKADGAALAEKVLCYINGLQIRVSQLQTTGHWLLIRKVTEGSRVAEVYRFSR